MKKTSNIFLVLLMLLIMTSCNLSLSDGTLFGTLENENQEGVDAGFAGGTGTEENPYLISSLEQFMLLENTTEYKYYALTNDITVGPEDFNIRSSFSGTLDGRGHSIIATVISPSIAPSDNTSVFCYVSEATFKNINYHMAGNKALTGYINGPVTFENVNAYSSNNSIQLLIDNVSAYTYYIGPSDVGDGYTVTFDNCTSNISYHDESGTLYGGQFVGGYIYAKNETIKTVFTDCTVNGDTLLGRAGVLFGNSANIENWGTVTVENLTLNGDVVSYQSNYPAGIGVWGSSSEVKNLNEKVEEKTNGNYEVRTLDDILTVDIEENTLKVSSTQSVSSYVLNGLAHIVYLNGEEGSYNPVAHATITIPISEEMTGSSTAGNYDISKLYVIDESSEIVASKNLTEQGWTEDNGNYYYYIPNFGLYDHAFFITDDNPVVKDEDGVVRFTSFAVTAYDSSEKVIGYKNITNSQT